MSFYFSLVGETYSVVFCFFWGLLLCGCVGIRVLEARRNPLAGRVEVFLYWLFGILMVAFAALRPIGIARDDWAYVDIYNSLCTPSVCGNWILGDRDWGWYSLMGWLKELTSNPRVILWVASVATLVKLCVIYSISRHLLPVLLIYCGAYYQVQDLTALRISLAIAIFMLAIWFIVRQRSYWNSWVLFCCGLFHKQAIVAPLILFGGMFKNRRMLLIALCVLPFILLFFNLYPDIESLSNEWPWIHHVVLNHGLWSYLLEKRDGGYQEWRTVPIVVYPQIILMVWLLAKGCMLNNRLSSLMTGCVVMGCAFLWGFASLPEAQIRFFEFFMLPTVLLVGIVRLSMAEFAGLVAVSGVYVMKYNVLHHLLV